MRKELAVEHKNFAQIDVKDFMPTKKKEEQQIVFKTKKKIQKKALSQKSDPNTETSQIGEANDKESEDATN